MTIIKLLLTNQVQTISANYIQRHTNNNYSPTNVILMKNNKH